MKPGKTIQFLSFIRALVLNGPVCAVRDVYVQHVTSTRQQWLSGGVRFSRGTGLLDPQPLTASARSRLASIRIKSYKCCNIMLVLFITLRTATNDQEKRRT